MAENNDHIKDESDLNTNDSKSINIIEKIYTSFYGIILLFGFFIASIGVLLFSTIQLLHKEYTINNLNDTTDLKIQNHKVIIQEYDNTKEQLDAITREKNKEEN